MVNGKSYGEVLVRDMIHKLAFARDGTGGRQGRPAGGATGDGGYILSEMG